MTRVFIADDHAIVREGLVRLIEGAAGLEVVGSAATSDEVLSAMRAQGDGWDVLVLDLSLPEAGGVEVLEQVKAARPALPVVIFTMHPEDRFAVRLLRAGASAYINKARAPDELVAAVRRVAGGGRYVTPTVGELLLQAGDGGSQPHDSLTAREYQILLLLLDGKQPSDISEELHVSMSTVSTHIRKVKEKIGARSTADLVRYGFRAGLIEL